MQHQAKAGALRARPLSRVQPCLGPAVQLAWVHPASALAQYLQIARTSTRNQMGLHRPSLRAVRTVPPLAGRAIWPQTPWQLTSLTGGPDEHSCLYLTLDACTGHTCQQVTHASMPASHVHRHQTIRFLAPALVADCTCSLTMHHAKVWAPCHGSTGCAILQCTPQGEV